MNNPDLAAKLELIKILDGLIEQGHWEGSPFMEATGKKLREMRETFYKDFDLEHEQLPESAKVSASSTVLKPSAESVEVYLSLYQADGLNLKKWEALLNSVTGYSIGRSIYATQDDIETWLRAKEYRQNDAYIAVNVLKTDINPFGDKPQLDRFDHTLLMVREGAIQPQNITKFMHTTGEFIFKGGKLIKKDVGSA